MGAKGLPVAKAALVLEAQAARPGLAVRVVLEPRGPADGASRSPSEADRASPAPPSAAGVCGCRVSDLKHPGEPPFGTRRTLDSAPDFRAFARSLRVAARLPFLWAL